MVEESVDVSNGKAAEILAECLIPQHLTDPYVIRFIGNYLHCHNVAQAARMSGISGSDGRNLFERPDIYKAISRITNEAVVKFGYDAAQVVERVKELAFVDIGDMFGDDGLLIEDIKAMPPELRRAIKKFKWKSYFENDVNGVPQYKGRIYEIELWDKPRSLELLAREKDTFKKTTVVQHDVSKNARDFLLDSMRRADTAIAAIDVTPVLEAPTATVLAAGFPKPPGAK